MADDLFTKNENLQPRLSEWEIKLAEDALVLALAMAKKFHVMWNENMGQIDEYTMQMLPHAVHILTTSRAWPSGVEHAF